MSGEGNGASNSRFYSAGHVGSAKRSMKQAWVLRQADVSEDRSHIYLNLLKMQLCNVYICICTPTWQLNHIWKKKRTVAHQCCWALTSNMCMEYNRKIANSSVLHCNSILFQPFSPFHLLKLPIPFWISSGENFPKPSAEFTFISSGKGKCCTLPLWAINWVRSSWNDGFS